MIKILFIDTNALLSFFISERATPTMRWMFSSEGAARYVINNQVITEFEQRIEEMINNNEIRQSTADSILSLFNTHYKNKRLKVVGKDASIEKTMEGIYRFLGCMSRPILVTCNQELATKIQKQGYQTINPQIQTPDEIQTLLTKEEATA